MLRHYVTLVSWQNWPVMAIALATGLVSLGLAAAWIPFARHSEPPNGIPAWLVWPTYGLGALVILVLLAAFGVWCIAAVIGGQAR